jgi:hypothetical protein
VQSAEAPVANGLWQMRRMLRRTVVEARHAGFPEEKIRQTFVALLTDSSSLFANRYLVLVGLFPTALQVYADDIERELARERVVVDFLTFDELRTRAAHDLADLGQADALLTPLHQIHLLRDVLQTSGLDGEQPIVGIRFTLRPSARQAIAALPANIRVGIVSSFPEFVNTMVQGIAAVHPLHQEPVICLAADPACVQVLCGTVQAIIYASGADAAIESIRGQLPSDFPLIEYLHTPDANTYRRIRQLLAVEEPSATP